MNNQLQQLEESISRLAARVNALTIENRQLITQVTSLQQQKQYQLDEFQRKCDELSRKFELENFQLQESLQQTISELTADKLHYQMILNNSGEEIRHLLQRLPVSQKEAS